MFEGLRKKLAKAANEEEEIVFKDIDEKIAPVAEELPEAPSQSSSLAGNNIELKVVRPESIEEITTIADHLLNGCTVVLNLEVLDGNVITRMLDFLNGVTYTQGGEIKNVSQDTYIITPNGININR
jgi:FtsZ-interacting cell division protein YlmF